MSNKNKISYFDLTEIVEKTNDSFLREKILANIKPSLGSGFLIWNDLGNGIASSISNYKLIKDQDIFLTSEIPGAVLIFNLGTDITYKYKNKTTFTLKKNCFIIGFASDEFYAEVSLKKNSHYNTLSIGIKEELFLQLANNLESMKNKMFLAKKNTYDLFDGKDIDPEQLEIISSFINRSLYKNLLEYLYLESKITTLSHYTIQKVLKKTNSNIRLNESIIKSLKKAKEIILKDYASSLSIKEIAYKSAINECYLKKDFKKFYGMTVYEMIQKQRLESSKPLLKNGISVKETALKVGYKHSGHFSKLFSENFGLSPSIYRKQFN